MEFYKRILCVTFEELTGGDNPVITPQTLMKNVQRGNIQCARRGGGENTIALYVYSSLPVKYKMKFEAKYGKPEDVLKAQELKDTVCMDEKAREFYESFEYDLNGVQTTLTDKLKEEYTVNASVLGMLWNRMNELTSTSNALGNGRRSDLWDIVFTQSEKLREVTGHTLPRNLARLKDKMNRYKKDGYMSVISGKVGNSNTLKITEDAGRRLVALKRSRVPVLTDRQIFDTFNGEAEGRGWKPLKSVAGMKAWLNSAAIEPLWYDAVHGEMSAHQKFDRRHKTQLPTMRDALWYGDGTKLNLYYRDEDGNVRTTGVYEVIDAATEVFLGFCISDTEDYEAQYMAYRMAIQVSGHKPYEIVHDNQGGHKRANSSGMLDKICHIHRTTAPYNGASKTIESVFGRFQQQVLHKDWRFTGQNITATKAGSRPNMEFIEANKDKLYTLDELKAAYLKARTEWNEMAHPATGESRIMMYEDSVNPDTPKVTVYDMIDMFWVTCSRMSTFTSSGIEITVKGQKRVYEVMSSPGVPDIEWRRKHTYQRFVVKYDPYDFGSIRLYWKDKAGCLRFERTAEPYIVIHRAIQEQTEGEAAFIRSQQAATEQNRIERQVAAKEIEYAEGVAPEQNGLTTPKLKGARSDVQRQIDRRTRKYSREPEELSLGRMRKTISNIDWMDTENDSTVVFLPRRVEKKVMNNKL
ncbi:kinase [Xylanibacter muris]|uniref:Kinase n=1 Tax=Xylanibacter muris TaxID=2736290 RepID=A0ABX2AN78_9BACT|nr:kinase [Xylanibacter muris]NPD91679.1 kinase [Xylanibacter muris]